MVGCLTFAYSVVGSMGTRWRSFTDFCIFFPPTPLGFGLSVRQSSCHFWTPSDSSCFKTQLYWFYVSLNFCGAAIIPISHPHRFNEELVINRSLLEITLPPDPRSRFSVQIPRHLPVFRRLDAQNLWGWTTFNTIWKIYCFSAANFARYRCDSNESFVVSRVENLFLWWEQGALKFMSVLLLEILG